MKNYTKKEADEIITEYKDNTAYFDGTLTSKEMYELFRYRYSFGEAETMTIIAALVKSGAKFQGKI